MTLYFNSEHCNFKFDMIGLTFPFIEGFIEIYTVVPLIEIKYNIVSPKFLIPEVTVSFEPINAEVNKRPEYSGVPVKVHDVLDC